jgi:hypothetical protein
VGHALNSDSERAEHPQEAAAIRECEEHGWMQDRADPFARERAIGVARRDPPPDISAETAVAEIQEVLTSIGDSCAERENGEA